MTRYRTQKFTHKLVLQVHEEYTYLDDPTYGNGGGEFRPGSCWRDAVVSDLAELDALVRK